MLSQCTCDALIVYSHKVIYKALVVLPTNLQLCLLAHSGVLAMPSPAAWGTAQENWPQQKESYCTCIPQCGLPQNAVT